MLREPLFWIAWCVTGLVLAFFYVRWAYEGKKGFVCFIVEQAGFLGLLICAIQGPMLLLAFPMFYFIRKHLLKMGIDPDSVMVP